MTQDQNPSAAEAEAELLERAEAWRAQDPDRQTAQQLADLIERTANGDAQATAELHARFDHRLAFGTAGLRGEMGAGPARMNRVLVSQAAAGLAAYLVEHGPAGERPKLVIGYDGRHNSEIFARDTAELAQAAGVDALLLPRAMPTPVTAFALRHLDAAAAVMVTASHNPGADNGYKVYLGGADEGSQIISPADQHIAAHIDGIARDFTVDQLPRSQAYVVLDDDVLEAYVAQTAEAIARRAPGDAREIPFVYTAMHGVGWETARLLFERLGITAPEIVDEQIAPDPDFPTVSFPNPEEPGALDLSFAKARATGAELIIANDPDADRLAVAIPAPDTEAGWRRLTGNEVGWLLGDLLASEHPQATPGALAASLVSSPLLGRIAAHYGLTHVETLTGFKYVNRVPNLVFGYEEALGYLVDPELVRDKDGISAAAIFLLLAARLRSQGETVAAALDRIGAEYGFAASDQVSLRVADVSLIAQATQELRDQPPTQIAGRTVEQAEDLAHGLDGLPPADILRYHLSDGSRVIVRPSGTEPKLKIYLDVSSSAADAAQAHAENAQALAELATWWREHLRL